MAPLAAKQRPGDHTHTHTHSYGNVRRVPSIDSLPSAPPWSGCVGRSYSARHTHCTVYFDSLSSHSLLVRLTASLSLSLSLALSIVTRSLVGVCACVCVLSVRTHLHSSSFSSSFVSNWLSSLCKSNSFKPISRFFVCMCVCPSFSNNHPRSRSRETNDGKITQNDQHQYDHHYHHYRLVHFRCIFFSIVGGSPFFFLSLSLSLSFSLFLSLSWLVRLASNESTTNLFFSAHFRSFWSSRETQSSIQPESFDNQVCLKCVCVCVL